jgi:4-diphosphocytidyl-2-C-methyl-D-erythritol kinase
VGGAGRELAPAKVNLCLCVGELRRDGRHELVSLIQSVTLCDELELTDADHDEVLCPGVEGPNLVTAALAAFRDATGWDGPPQRIEIVKRIPVAAGMGGGSADAAAALRLLARRSGLGGGELLHELAAQLGSDVPSQLRPGRVLVRGAGELVARLPDPRGLGVLVLPSRASLQTAAVYREADRLGPRRSAGALAALDPLALIGVNDLEAAALSLQPSIAAALALAREAGAAPAMVCGSGPTAIGLFDDPLAAADAAATLRAAGVDARAARPFPGSAAGAG